MDAPWVKSSFSFANGNCVEVAELPGDSVGIRDSRDPGGPVLRFTRAEWAAFLGGARRRELERSRPKLAGARAQFQERPPRTQGQPVDQERDGPIGEPGASTLVVGDGALEPEDRGMNASVRRHPRPGTP